MTVKLYAISGDPDTEKAITFLKTAKIGIQLVDVEKEGIISFLDRDLGVRELPFLLLRDATVEGLEAIKSFARQAK